MIVCKLNGTERLDISIQQGAKIAQNADHKTSSTAVLSVPVGETQPMECDYLQIYSRQVIQPESVNFPDAPEDFSDDYKVLIYNGAVGRYELLCWDEVPTINITYLNNYYISTYPTVNSRFAYSYGAIGGGFENLPAMTELTTGNAYQWQSHPVNSTIFIYSNVDLYNWENVLFFEGRPDEPYNIDTLIYAGTILSLDQTNRGYSDLTEKRYSCKLANNVDFISTACVDLIIPEGANCNLIMNGNRVGDVWYDRTLGEFNGLTTRLVEEGLTIGTIDDLGTAELADTANLWGQTLPDVIDQVASVAGAWWEVTPEKVFNMRLNVTKQTAPIVLNTSAEVYDLKVKRDAYTLYSAVRVMGSSEGRGANLLEQLTYDVTAPATTDTAYTGRDISAINNLGIYGQVNPSPVLQYGYGGIGDTSSGSGAAVYKVGVTGLHEDDPTYSFLYSSSSNEIRAKTGFEFTEDKESDWYLSYYPIVPIVSRVVDEELIAEIKAQRGGSGIVEYILNDSNIRSFNEANAMGAEFLKTNAKRAQTIEFTTKQSGLGVGQILKASNYPYYGIVGDYEITSLDTVLTEIDDDLQFVYEVKAGTTAYRNELTALQPRKQKFTLGTESQFLPSAITLIGELEIITTLKLQGTDPITWDEFEATYDDWADLETTYSDWEDIEPVLLEVVCTANYWTAEGKARFAKAMASSGVSTQLLGTSVKLELYNSSDGLLAEVFPISSALPTADAAINTFYLYENQANDRIDYIKVMSSDGVEIQRITDVDFTKTNLMTLSISKKDEVQ